MSLSPDQIELLTATKNKLIGQDEFGFEEETCVLRSSTGTSCFIGLMITDEHYSKALENTASPMAHKAMQIAVKNSHPEVAMAVGNFQDNFWEACSKLQEEHDSIAEGSRDIKEFEETFDIIMSKFS